jgi:hypothetical protein
MNPPADSGAILVFPSQGEGDCPHCAAPLHHSAFVTFKNDAIACVKCGGLENLEFLPSGNTALTRRANALSAVKYVVLKFSRARKRYERQGILASPEILDQARRECEADEAARESKRQASAARREKQDTTHLAVRAPMPASSSPPALKKQPAAGSIADFLRADHPQRMKGAKAAEFVPYLFRWGV